MRKPGMFWKTHTDAVAGHTLSTEERSWVNTLKVESPRSESGASVCSSASWTTAPSSPADSAWTTAPSSPECLWPSLPAMPGLSAQELKKAKRRATNRQSAKLSRERKIAHEQELQERVAEIERTNAALRAQIELELEANAALKESLGMEVDV